VHILGTAPDINPWTRRAVWCRVPSFSRRPGCRYSLGGRTAPLAFPLASGNQDNATLALTLSAGIGSTASVATITTCPAVQHIFAGITEEPVRARASEKSVIAGSTTDDIVTPIASDHVIPAEALDDVRTCGADDGLAAIGAHDRRRQSVTGERRWLRWLRW
jgi:hypothetical protein